MESVTFTLSSSELVPPVGTTVSIPVEGDWLELGIITDAHWSSTGDITMTLRFNPEFRSVTPDHHAPSPFGWPPVFGATTRELLAEVAGRMEATQNSIAGCDLGRMCRTAIDNLDEGVLNFRPHSTSGG